MTHPQFHRLFLFSNKTDTPVTSASCLRPQPHTAPQHHPALWLIRWGAPGPPSHPRPDFPVTLWLLKLTSRKRRSQVGLQGEAHEMRVVSSRLGRGTSICPGLPSLLASLQSADRVPSRWAQREGRELEEDTSRLCANTCSQWFEKWSIWKRTEGPQSIKERRNEEFLALKCTLLVIRAVRFNLFTLDCNKRKWDQLQTSLLWQQ